MTTKEDIFKHIEWYQEHYKIKENPIFEIILFEKGNETYNDFEILQYLFSINQQRIYFY